MLIGIKNYRLEKEKIKGIFAISVGKETQEQLGGFCDSPPGADSAWSEQSVSMCSAAALEQGGRIAMCSLDILQSHF